MLNDLVACAQTLKRIDSIKKHKDYSSLLQKTKFLKKNVSLRQRIWHAKHELYEIPRCKHCQKNQVAWRKTAYVNYCSMKCLSNDKSVLDKRKQTNLKKYGVENPQQSKEIQEKTKQTNLERYDVEYVLKSETIRKRIETTNLERYGNICSLHGNDISEKVKQTNLKKYGFEYASQSPEFKDHVRKTNYQNSGYFYLTQKHIKQEDLSKLNNKKWLYTEHITKQKPAQQIASDCNVTTRTVLSYMDRLGIPLKHFYQSQQEKELIKFIKKHYDKEILTNTRKIISPFEIDIYLPDINVAIEFNGTYWHSELNGKNRQYHLNKTKLCNEKNIHLIHIWEYNWVTKKDIIKSMLLSKFNKLPYKINARECLITIIGSKQSSKFLKSNHIQGTSSAFIYYGLMYNNELVAVMTFIKSRFSKKYEYELLRFCTKKYTNVRGAASKMFKHFLNDYNPKSIISYSDKGRNTGNVYEILGFDQLHISPPNYFYFHKSTPNIMHSRIKFQKHKLENRLEIFDLNISEWQNMINNGYDRIWDCGNIVYLWTKDK